MRVEENKDEEVTHKLQLTAENIRAEAKDKYLEYSTTHNIKASSDGGDKRLGPHRHQGIAGQDKLTH